jgi:hypothetical protein
MMRYLLFAGASYYASGGIHDLIDMYETYDEALATASLVMTHRPTKENDWTVRNYDWWHIYSMDDRRIVAGSKCQAYGAEEIPSADVVEIGT